jgi:hypothetical protein
MATTSLFVEILVVGSIAEIWIALLLFSFGNLDSASMSLIAGIAEKFSTLLLFPLLTLTYAVGWVVNFLTERLFKFPFQSRFRDRVFKNSGVMYSDARSIVVQNASQKVIDEMDFDRHILRVSRSSVFSFIMIAIALSRYLDRNSSFVVAGIVVSLAISTLSFLQWFTRYKHSYVRILDAYKAINSKVKGDKGK